MEKDSGLQSVAILYMGICRKKKNFYALQWYSFTCSTYALRTRTLRCPRPEATVGYDASECWRIRLRINCCLMAPKFCVLKKMSRLVSVVITTTWQTVKYFLPRYPHCLPKVAKCPNPGTRKLTAWKLLGNGPWNLNGFMCSLWSHYIRD